MTEATKVRRSGQMQSVHRTLEALEHLAAAPDGVTVIQLATTLDVDKSVASRLLATLLELGYVVRDPLSERYELSLRLVTIASSYADRIGFPAVCQPLLARLAVEVGELVQLSVVEADQLVLAAHEQARRRLALLPSLGENVAPHATASGKVWLASLAPDRAAEIALRHGLKEMTGHTVTGIQGLLRSLDDVRRHGYAINTGEFMDDVNAIAYPIGPQRFGKVVGTVAVSGPASRFDADRIRAVASQIAAVASELEQVWPIAAVRLAHPIPA